MIIKSLKIDSFGGIENKIVNFSRGVNIVFGENEAGKSTIESFIKAMLYGFPQKRGRGDGDRKRYLPFKGGVIKGEMTLESKGKEYIIQRIFGTTKKEDTTKVIDGLTGVEVNEINLEEPGKSFLGINRATFEKTLFISQLGVAFGKDKEEEIMDKITALFGCSEDEVPAAKAIEKIEGAKKELTTTRGVGALDQFKKKYSLLLEERYEGYKLAEQNLEWENQLLVEKEKREFLNDEITKLELYKKYLKRVKLQGEYKDITEYLKKSEELKREEKKLGDLIDESFIEDLKETNKTYLNLIDRREERLLEVKNLDKLLNDNNKEYEEYRFLDVFEEDLKDKLMSLKYEQSALEEKINNMTRLQDSIVEEEGELLKKRGLLTKVNDIREIKNELEDSLENYEEKLKEIKFLVEKNRIPKDLEARLKKENTKMLFGILLIGGGVGLSFLGMPLLLIGLTILFGGGFLVFRSITKSAELRQKTKVKNDIDDLTKDISILEEKLNMYMVKVDANNYGDLISILKKYNSYKEHEDRISLRIEEKKKMINEGELYKDKERFKKNYDMISSLKKMSRCNSVDDVLEKIDIYDKLKKQQETLELEISRKKDGIRELESEIQYIEEKLREKLMVMDLDLGNLLDIEIYIKEYKEKLYKRAEIHANLLSMEETYKALLKDRDIDAIKEELKDIITDNNEYSYQSEEEIELEEKKKSRELIECEKKIKDLENSISTRLIGKRNIVDIEEEIQEVSSKINIGEQQVKALELAIDTLEDSFYEIRREVGPEINRKILCNFKELTEGKYEDVKLGDNYEMMVRDKDNLFKGSYLSNGSYDQLYLALRLAFIELLFEGEEYPIILDDAFVQYDDNRREKAVLAIKKKINGQGIIFTCQHLEETILMRNNIDGNIINI